LNWVFNNTQVIKIGNKSRPQYSHLFKMKRSWKKIVLGLWQRFFLGVYTIIKHFNIFKKSTNYIFGNLTYRNISLIDVVCIKNIFEILSNVFKRSSTNIV